MPTGKKRYRPKIGTVCWALVGAHYVPAQILRYERTSSYVHAEAQLANGSKRMFCLDQLGSIGDEKFAACIRDCGIMPKGVRLAQVIWDCAREIFKAAPDMEHPFEVATFANRILQAYAADVQQENYSKKEAL